MGPTKRTAKKFFDDISIRAKIFMYLLGFCMLLLIILWLFQIVFLDDFYKRIKISEVRKSATAIVNNIDNKDLQTLVNRISTSNDVCIELLTENGTEIYSSDVLRDCVIHRMPVFEKIKIFMRAQENGGELLEYFDRSAFRDFHYNKNDFYGTVPTQDKGMEESIIYSKIMTNKSGALVIVLINSVVSPVASTVKTLQVQLNYITLFMLILAPILAYIIAKAVSSPIVALNNSTKIMAKGDFDVYFSGGGYREISELSDTLNFTAKELAKVDRLKTELIANISHDLRTPLTLISGYAEAMRDLPDENTPENAQIIVDETKRLTSLVNDVLDVSKLQSGTQAMNMQVYSLTKSVEEVVTRVGEMLKKDNYKIAFFYDEEVMIQADETRMTQVFYNLLSNAINYTGEDRAVKVVQRVKGNGRVRIEISDSGEGISQEEIDLIWDRYYKSNKIHKRAVTGTGLGLSIVKNIMEQHRGDCGVSSTIGKGSTFWFEVRGIK